MKAFVAGATGGTGRRIVEELVQRGISVRAMVRDLETAKATLPNQVELVLGNVLDKKAIEERSLTVMLYSVRQVLDLVSIPLALCRLIIWVQRISLMLPKLKISNILC